MDNNAFPWDLIVSKLRGDLSAKEEIRFDAWLKHEKNQDAYSQLERIWTSVQEETVGYEPDVKHCWEKLSARMAECIVDEVFGVGQSKARRRFSLHRVAIPRVAVVASVVLMLTFPCAFYLGKHSSDPQKLYTYSTTNSKARVMLPDSTEVWLHNQSSLTYKLNKAAEQREVLLNGEAYFDVKSDDRVPFVVSSNGLQVRVYGTEFNVNSYPATGEVAVCLFEGSVSMKAAEEEIYLKPGEEGHFDLGNKTMSVTKADLELANIWMRDEIRFENKNLREVCRYLSKWYGTDIHVDPEIDDDQSYTFTFRGSPLAEVVEVLTNIHSYDYVINQENNVVLIKKRRCTEQES